MVRETYRVYEASDRLKPDLAWTDGYELGYTGDAIRPQDAEGHTDIDDDAFELAELEPQGGAGALALGGADVRIENERQTTGVPAGEPGGDESDPGRAVMDEIRQCLRTGEAKFGQINPVIASRYAQERAALQATAQAWIAEHPTPGLRVDDAVRRFSNIWTLHALRSDDPIAVMADSAGATQALHAYITDVSKMREMGLGASAEANATYNEVSDLQACIDMKADSRHLTDEAIRRCAANRPRDIVDSVRGYIRKAEMLEEHFGTRLDDSLLRHFAARQSMDSCVGRVNDYLRDVDLLSERYKNHEFITPSIIRSFCKDSANPGLAIEGRLAVADDYMDQYAGKQGLTRAEVFKVITDQANPQTRLEGYLASIEAVREKFKGVLPDEAIRSLCLGPGPMAAGRRLVSRMEALATSFKEDPNIRPSDVFYFASNNGAADEADLVAKIQKYSDNVSRATEAFADDSRVNGEMIRRASYQLDTDVVGVVKGKLAVMDTLKLQFASAGIPEWIYRRAVSQESDPEGAIRDYLRDFGGLCERFGPEISDSVIRVAMMNYQNAGDVLSERIPTLRAWRERYGIVVAESSLQWGAVLSAEPQSRLAKVVGSAILEQMRAERSAHPRGTPNPDKSFADQYAAFERWLASNARDVQLNSPSSGAIDVDRAMRSFKAGLLRFIKASGISPDVLNDRMVLGAAWETYWADSLKLEEIGFIRPDLIASYKYNTALTDRILTSDLPKRDLALADSRPSAPLGRIEQYHATVADLTARFGTNKYASKAMINHVAKGYPTEPVKVMKDHLQALHELETTFREVPEVTEEVYVYLTSNFIVSPEQYVYKYLARRELLGRLFVGDPDFTDDALTNLSLATSWTEREQLKYHGECYKERLSEMRRRVLLESIEVEDQHLVTAAARKGTTIAGRLNFAKLLQRMRNAEDASNISLTAPVSSDAKSSEFQDIVADPNQMTTEEIAVENVSVSETFGRLRPLLAACSSAERTLLAYKVAGVTDQVDEVALGRELKTRDLDAYLEQLLLRLRRQAIEAGLEAD